MANHTNPLVSLVGAGPGNPGLLTLRAVECLAQADVVIYDKLVPVRLMDFVPETAQQICVSELPAVHPDRYPLIHQTLIEHARQGKRVVRLKGGDPFVFGRGGEEAEALRQAGIPFEVVPGVTSGLAAAACAGIPLTHRDHASAVALITGHEHPGKPGSSLDWASLAKFPGTLVIYMGISRLTEIVDALLKHGKAPNTPAAAVHWASTGDQRTLESPLDALPRAAQASGLTAPAITIIGDVVSLRPKLSWFEQRPLFGKRVLVTRPKHQANDLVSRLEKLGAVPVVLPTVEISDPPNWQDVDRALHNLATYDWLVFTSANGVHALLRRLMQIGRDLRALGGVKLAAIGPATAQTLRGDYHLKPDLVPAVFNSESLAAALKEHAAGKRILLARADRGRDLLRQELSQIATVDQVAVYCQSDAVIAAAEAIDRVRRGEIDYVTLTSSNIARALIAALDDTCRARIRDGTVKLVTISPETTGAVKELGLDVAAEAREYTTAGIVEAVVGAARQLA
jgi:uroporphyrinogen III methyltransferase/synthase